MSQPLRLAVFDVDGTLVDSQHHIAAAMAQTYAAEGLDSPPLEQVRGIIGLSLPHAMRQLSPDLTDAQYDALVEGYKATFRNKREAGQSAPLYAGIRDLLDGLVQDDHLLLGVATGKSRRGLDAMLRVHGLEKMFVTAQVADDHPSKPHPSMLYTTLSDTGVEAQHGVMIGDTTFDMEMGCAAGMVSIGVSWGYHDADRLRAAGAVHIVDDTVALGALLTELWG